MRERINLPACPFSASRDKPPSRRPGGFAVRVDGFAVHDRHSDALRPRFRVFIGRGIHDFSRIEYDDVRRASCGYSASVVKSEYLSGKARHLVDGFLHRKQLQIARVSSNYPRKRSPQPRMRMLVVRKTVRPDHGELGFHDPLDVVFAHLEIDGSRGLQPLSGVKKRHSPFVGNVGKVAAIGFRVGFRPSHHYSDLVGHKIVSEYPWNLPCMDIRQS